MSRKLVWLAERAANRLRALGKGGVGKICNQSHHKIHRGIHKRGKITTKVLRGIRIISDLGKGEGVGKLVKAYGWLALMV